MIHINRPHRSFRKISSIDKPILVHMCTYVCLLCIPSTYQQISSDLSTFFDYFNLALSHSLDIFVPTITFINRTYYIRFLLLMLTYTVFHKAMFLGQKSLLFFFFLVFVFLLSNAYNHHVLLRS